VAVITT